MKRMIQAADPIAFACYFSLFEYYKIALDYVYTIIDVNQLVYNIFHNAGHIYDSVTSIIENVRFNDYKQRGYWVNIGNNVGYILNQVSYKPQDYDPYHKDIKNKPGNNSTNGRNEGNSQNKPSFKTLY